MPLRLTNCYVLLVCWLLIWPGDMNAEEAPTVVGHVRMLVQDSPLAGSQYHDVNAHWEQLQVGDDLTLRREPDNPHDAKAIRIEWRGRLLGYVPRRENRAVAAALDGGDELVGRITRLQPHRNPWLRVRFAIYADL